LVPNTLKSFSFDSFHPRSGSPPFPRAAGAIQPQIHFLFSPSFPLSPLFSISKPLPLPLFLFSLSHFARRALNPAPEGRALSITAALAAGISLFSHSISQIHLLIFPPELRSFHPSLLPSAFPPSLCAMITPYILTLLPTTLLCPDCPCIPFLFGRQILLPF